MLELPDEIDLRHLSEKRVYTVDPKTKVRTGVFYADRTRTAEEITGIVCHQTACLMGERPERYLATGAHRIVTRGGQRIRLHDNTDVIVSANGFDMRCVSIEGDGLYAGDDTTPQRALATTWDDKSTRRRELPMGLSPEFVAAYRETIRSIVREVAAAGGKVVVLLAHRQSSGTRQSDPGRGIYQQVMLPVAKELGLKIGPDVSPYPFKIGDGRAIPECWDPRMKGVKY